MKTLPLIFFLFAVSILSPCYGSRIDSINTMEAAREFVRSQFPGIKYKYNQYGLYSSSNAPVLDSLHAFNWTKCDIDRNGKIDLIIIGDSILFGIYVVLAYQDSFAIETLDFPNSYVSVYPVISNKGNSPQIILHYENAADVDKRGYPLPPPAP